MPTKSTVENPQQMESTRREAWKMFDRIAHRYDLLNRLLSFGRDVAWRKRVARHLPPGGSLSVLDLATGTGDLLISMVTQRGGIAEALGIDLAEKMLAVGKEKLRRRRLDGQIRLQPGDAADIPFEDDHYDAVTIAFGIRNVPDVPLALREMRRVLKPGGRVLILEFSLPANYLVRHIYLFYFRHILPLVGSLISGDSYAYRYLNRTVEIFPYGQEFLNLLTAAGFENVGMTPLTFGVATIYQGDKSLSAGAPRRGQGVEQA